MTTKEFDSFIKTFLDIEWFASCDDSLNGIQVDNNGADIKKIAFAVDASLESIKGAKNAGADLLFVHHGLFWGKAARIKDALRERLYFLLSCNIALYACHLPLDAAPVVGNNAVLARLLGIENPQGFGDYHGKKIGLKGKLEKPLTADEAAKKIAFNARSPTAVYPFGKEKSETAAVISGGAASLAIEAIDEGIDLYVTGEAGHSIYHYIMEGKLNMVAGGHYNTEVWGVRAVMEKVKAECKIEVEFLDLPTGL